MFKTIKKIIYITDYPVNQRDYDRIGIKLLRSHGFEVEIWDITECLHKNFLDQLTREDPTLFEGLKIFREQTEVVHAISVLDATCLINCFLEYSVKTYFLFRAISKKGLRYCVSGMVSFPNPYPPQETFFRRISLLIKKGAALNIKEITDHVFNKILLDYYFFFGITPATLILLAGEKSSGKPAYPVNKRTTRLWAHMLDYDIYLQDREVSSRSGKRIGVFLDEYYPFHPDFFYQDVACPVTAEKYFPSLCNFFSILEKKMGVEIIIAAHPKAEYETDPDYFCGRSTFKGVTSRLVRESAFVIAHDSTSINFAVLYHKPIVFITTDQLNRMVSGKNINGLLIIAIALELGKIPINIDQLPDVDWDSEMMIDEAAYSRYKNNYIKKWGTPEKPLWEIYCSYIQHQNSHQ